LDFTKLDLAGLLVAPLFVAEITTYSPRNYK
jgi:hypothetical protein